MNKIIIAAQAVVIAGAAGAYFLGFLDGFLGKETATEESVSTEEVKDERPPIFYKLPKLTVSANYNGRLRYVQASLSIMTKNEETIEKLSLNTPLIQNAMIILIGSLEFSVLETNEGKEELRGKAEEEINSLIDGAEIDSVLFTGFVIQ